MQHNVVFLTTVNNVNGCGVAVSFVLGDRSSPGDKPGAVKSAGASEKIRQHQGYNKGDKLQEKRRQRRRRNGGASGTASPVKSAGEGNKPRGYQDATNKPGDKQQGKDAGASEKISPGA